MTGIEVVISIAVGILSSILATVIMIWFSKAYNVGYKKDFRSAVETAVNAVCLIETRIGFPQDYLLVMGQIDCVMQAAFQMYRSLTLLALWHDRNKKKFIVTLLNDIIQVCKISKMTAIGNEGVANENAARIERIRRYFYKWTSSEDDNISTVRVQLNILSSLIDGKSIEDALLETGFDIEEFKKPDFIEINSFKHVAYNDALSRDCYTKNEFNKILHNISGK